MNYMHEACGRLGRVGGQSGCRWRPAWRQLLALEPDLAAAEAAVVLMGRPTRAGEWRFAEGFVGGLVGVFGKNALHPVLGEMESYEAAMEHLRRLSESLRQPPRWRRRRRW
jgi:hypothetical protein